MQDSTAIKLHCVHDGATLYMHRCPSCDGVLRRCCDSVVLFAHTAKCLAVEDKANGRVLVPVR